MKKLLIALLLATVPLTGCGSNKTAEVNSPTSKSSATPEPSKKELTKVNYALLGAAVTNIHTELAVEKGIFAKHGIDLKLFHFQKGGPEALAAASSGDVDMGNFGSPIITGISKGIPIKVVAAPVAKEVDFTLVALNQYKNVQDLKGQVIVTGAAGSGPHVAIKKILAANNLKESEVKIVNNGGADMEMILQSGKVGAVIAQEPVVSKIEASGLGHTLVKAADVYGKYQHSYLFASNKLIQKDPETVRNVLQAYAESVQYVKSHPDELMAYAKEKLGLDEKTVKNYYDKNLSSWDEKLKVDVEGGKGAIELLKEVGDIQGNYNPKVEDWYDSSFELK